MCYKSRIFAAILAVVLLLSLFGCVENPSVITSGSDVPSTGDPPENTTVSNNGGSQKPSVNTDPTEPAVDPRIPECQYVPAEVYNPENLPILKWVCLCDMWTRVWTEDAAVELNQMLSDRDMPFRVQFAIMTYHIDDIYAAPPTSPYVDWFSMPEVQEILKDADLIYAAMSGQEMVEYLVPITDNVYGSASPSLKNAVPHEHNWLTQTVDGEIYGIPSGPSQGTTTGWMIDSSFYSRVGLKETDLARNFWEMDAIFADMYQKNGNRPFLHINEETITSLAEVDEAALPQRLPGSVGNFIRGTFTCVGSCFAIDKSSGSPKVVNLMETDVVRLYQEAMFRYKSAGYVTADEAEAQIRYGSGLADFYYPVYGSSYRYYPVTDPILFSVKPGGYTIGVAASSRDSEAGKKLLSLIADDETFRMQLLFGKEGRDYSVYNGFYSKIEQDDRSSYSMEFLSPLSYFSGFACDGSVYAEDGKTALESFWETLDHSTVCYPIVFDYSGLEKELASIQTVIELYFPNLIATEEIPDDPFTEVEDPVPVMDEVGYNQMLQAFKDAGSDKIISELQGQLDEWLAKNPDW